MRPALSRPSPALRLPLPGTGALTRAERRNGARRRRTLAPRLLRDIYLGYTVAMLPIAALVLLASQQFAQLVALGVLGALFVGAQATLGGIPSRLRPLTALGWSFLRLSLTLLFVAGIVELSGGANGPLSALFLPVVVAAAALGTLQAVVIGGVAAVIFLAPELARIGAPAEVAVRGITLAGVSVLLAFATRRLVLTIERTSRQLRSAMVAERRRSRQVVGMEEISRVLVEGGPTAEVLDRALGLLSDRFGYQHVSIYLADHGMLVMGAQRGYEHPIATFDGTAGVIGRAMRTHRLQFVPDVRQDPDYISVFGEVGSEICAPLLIDGGFIGILNVESADRLDRIDRDLVASLADRIATVVALGRDRQALAERAATFRSLHEFTQSISGTLEVDRLAATLVDAARRVVRADFVALTVLERESGRYRVRAITDVDPAILGGEVRPGESLAGRAIRDRSVIIDDQFGTPQFPEAYRDTVGPMVTLGAGIPLIRDGTVLGALSLVRRDREDRFRPIEREAMELLAGHGALALANAFLHSDVAQLAIRDPLTGLYNRRYFDETLDRIIAAWHRSDAASRRPVAAVIFDLDHFGDFNKAHGHQVGDLVLRSFASILRARFRVSDLVARLGGEEFIVILDGAAAADAQRLAEEVREALAGQQLANEDGDRLVVTVSAGCTQLDEGNATREQLLRTADVALFMAKRAGRDRVVCA
jgi:diguanylate cyclase (GGDEF)-like protein